jgi:hypothetical protein
MISPAPEFMAKRHRYADGRVYNEKRYDLLVNIGTGDTPYYRVIGGMLVLKDKVIAFVGGTAIGDKVQNIIAHADHFEWGDSAADALFKIKLYITANKLIDR